MDGISSESIIRLKTARDPLPPFAHDRFRGALHTFKPSLKRRQHRTGIFPPDDAATNRFGSWGGKAVMKLAAVSITLIGLISVWIADRDGALGAVAAVSTVVLAGPIELLVAIDTAKALRLAGSRSTILGVPELILGAIACLASVCGFWLLFFGNLKNFYFVSGCFMSGVLLLLGARWLRSGWQVTRRSSL